MVKVVARQVVVGSNRTFMELKSRSFQLFLPFSTF